MTRNGATTGPRAARSLRDSEDDGRLIESVELRRVRDESASLTPPSVRATMSKSRIDRMWIMRHHDRLPSNRMEVTQPAHPPLPPQFLIQQALNDHTEGAAAFVFSIRVAAGCLWRGLSPRSFTGRSNGPASAAPERSRRILSRCLKVCFQLSAHWARPPRLAPQGRVLLTSVLRGRDTPSARRRTFRRLRFAASPHATAHDAGTSRVARERPTGVPGRQAVQVILKEPRVRGVNPVSRTPRSSRKRLCLAVRVAGARGARKRQAASQCSQQIHIRSHV